MIHTGVLLTGFITVVVWICVFFEVDISIARRIEMADLDQDDEQEFVRQMVDRIEDVDQSRLQITIEFLQRRGK